MAENKKSFVLYADLIHTVKKMPNDKAGELLKVILSYVNDENPVIDDMVVDLVFEPIKRQMKRDLIKYEDKKEQWSKAGKRSAEERALRKANEAATDSTDVEIPSTDSTVNDTVNVNVNDTVNDTVTVRESNTADAKIAPPVDLSKSNLFRQPVIPTMNQVWESFSKKGGTREMARKFWDDKEATGWFHKGSPITNFENFVGNFVESWNRINNKGSSFATPVNSEAQSNFNEHLKATKQKLNEPAN